MAPVPLNRCRRAGPQGDCAVHGIAGGILPPPPQVYLSGNYDTSNAALTSMLQNYKAGIDSYVCANVPDNPLHSVKTSPEGLLYFGEVNSQYVTGAAFLVSVHSDYLATYASTLTCGAAVLSPATTFAFSKAQMDYILGVNSARTSYMVGFSPTYPQQAHHRGASNPSIYAQPPFTGCAQTYSLFYSSPDPNPNVHVGAILGGPDAVSCHCHLASLRLISIPLRFIFILNTSICPSPSSPSPSPPSLQTDKYTDLRSNANQNEPTTYINSGAVGVLAKLFTLSSPIM